MLKKGRVFLSFFFLYDTEYRWVLCYSMFYNRCPLKSMYKITSSEHKKILEFLRFKIILGLILDWILYLEYFPYSSHRLENKAFTVTALWSLFLKKEGKKEYFKKWHLFLEVKILP